MCDYTYGEIQENVYFFAILCIYFVDREEVGERNKGVTTGTSGNQTYSKERKYNANQVNKPNTINNPTPPINSILSVFHFHLNVSIMSLMLLFIFIIPKCTTGGSGNQII